MSPNGMWWGRKSFLNIKIFSLFTLTVHYGSWTTCQTSAQLLKWWSILWTHCHHLWCWCTGCWYSWCHIPELQSSVSWTQLPPVWNIIITIICQQKLSYSTITCSQHCSLLKVWCPPVRHYCRKVFCLAMDGVHSVPDQGRCTSSVWSL